MKTKKPILTIMSGLPRSGKSTWVLKNKKQNDIVISSDEIRLEIFGHIFHIEAESYIWALIKSFILILMKQQKNIIVDTTGLNTRARTQYNQLAEKYGYKTRLIWIDTPYIECVKRNKKTSKIPEQILTDMKVGFDFNSYKGSEGFDESFRITNNKKIKIP